MSRGPGRMQRYVLEHFAEKATHKAFDRQHWLPLHVLAWCYRRDQMHRESGHPPDAYMVDVDYAEQESLRRAVNALAKAGRLETCQLWYPVRDRYARDWSGLHCRLSAAEYESLSVGESPTLSSEEAGQLIAGLANALTGGPP